MPQRLSPNVSAIVLLSGGLDSTYNLAQAARYRSPALALTFDYGQRAANAEIKAARAICRRYGITHRVISLPWLRALAPPAMVRRGAPLPSRPGGIGAVWVPNRNGVFLAVGAAFAEALGAGVVVVGFNAEEATDFPDNSNAFITAANRALRYSAAGRVRVISYSSSLDKETIVRRSSAAGVPLRLIYPCYTEGPKACGRCVSCRRTAVALKAAGLAATASAIFAPFRAKRKR